MPRWIDTAGSVAIVWLLVKEGRQAMSAPLGARADRPFLLELLARLQVIDLADECSYRMPLTQELVADALGLSVPHDAPMPTPVMPWGL
ncbi:MAG TPA: hypothetical protein VE687_17905 [Stellaceae bacterium]|nr:hypothetical protein [Stellaceae bacterium]